MTAAHKKQTQITQGLSTLGSFGEETLRQFSLARRIHKEFPLVHRSFNHHSDDPHAEILKILRHFFPCAHALKQLRLRTFDDGITNKLFKVVADVAGGEQPFPPLLVRVYGHETHQLIDREQELMSLVCLNDAGLSPPLYGRFQNGICYGFVDGVPFTVEDMRKTDKAQLVARALAKFHMVDVYGKSYKQPSVFNILDKWIEVVARGRASQKTLKQRGSCQRSAALFSDHFLKSELEILKSRLVPLDADVCYCHNDLLAGNILYCLSADGSERVRFIDFEYGNYNYVAWDIVNHFNEMMGYSVDLEKFPSTQFRTQWIAEYVRCYNKKKFVPLGIQEQIDKLLVHTLYFAPCSHFFWGVWSLAQAFYSLNDFDYIEYAERKLNAYLSTKHLLPSA